MKKYLKPLALFTVITIIFGTIYVSAQQILRMGANDPQIQMAQDTAAKLNNDNKPAALAGDKIDVSTSLAPFTLIYDKQGKNVSSAAYTGSQPLRDISFGVLQSTGSGYNAVTWQPETNVRLAAVVVKANDYFVVSARNIVEVEKCESTVLWLAALGWLLSLAVVASAYWLSKYLK
ncbi:hypothetical protein BH10PAT3_BH10PAT3_4310 [soil metagenome]